MLIMHDCIETPRIDRKEMARCKLFREKLPPNLRTDHSLSKKHLDDHSLRV